MNNRIIILLGSPRKKGNTAAMAEGLSESAQQNGAVVESVYLNGMNIKPCQGCEKCQQTDATGCTIDDDMQALYGRLQSASSVVLASPVYWFNFTAQMKLFIDRLYAVGVGRNNIFAGKQFAILLSYADSDPFISGAANVLRVFQDFCSYLEVTIAGMVYGTADKPGEIKADHEVMKQVRQLGEKLSAR